MKLRGSGRASSKGSVRAGGSFVWRTAVAVSASTFLCLAMLGCAHVTLPERAPSTTSPVIKEVDAQGVLTWAIVPQSYDARRAAPWIIYDHGFGQTIESIAADDPQRAFVQSLAAAGFVVVASEYRDLACWGNEACAEDVANLQALWRSRLNLEPKPFVIGESMGGIVTWNAISRGVLQPQAVVGIYPVCNLAAMYAKNVFAPTIQSAYGFDSPQKYSAATAGFDPMLDAPATFTGFAIEMWASRSDSVVRRSQNEDPFARAINDAGGNVTIHTSEGEHGDPSNFDAPAVIAFFQSHRT